MKGTLDSVYLHENLELLEKGLPTRPGYLDVDLDPVTGKVVGLA